jgi:Lrp/AsnC family leucine-responsive transcriptional regulator
VTKKLDAIDVAILEALQRDGRLSNVTLAKTVGLSPTPCAERVRALEAAGIIDGYTAVLDAERLGLGLLVFIEIAIDRTSEDAFDAFRAAVMNIPEVQECHMVAGGFDYLLKVRVADMAAYRTFLGDVLSKVAGIRQTHTYAVMERVKESRHVDLAHLATRERG